MNKNLIIAVGITILFLGLSIQSSIATPQLKEIDENSKPILGLYDKPENKRYIRFDFGFLWGNYSYRDTYTGVLFLYGEPGDMKTFGFIKGVGFRFYKTFTGVEITPFCLGKISGDEHGGKVRFFITLGYRITFGTYLE